MILVRHGQTLWNLHFHATRIDPGIPDPGLTELGRQQAENAGKRLRGAEVTQLVVSPYRRTLETADILLRHIDAPVRIEPRIRERGGFSCDVGSVRSLLCDRWPHHDFAHLDETWWMADETDSSLETRCHAFREEHAAHPQWDRIVVVTHWGVIRALTGRVVDNGQQVRLPRR
jgi:broad specificity phosphatase PhoE